MYLFTTQLAENGRKFPAVLFAIVHNLSEDKEKQKKNKIVT